MADQQLTMEQFGQRIKAKHPEYADIPDAELGQRVIAKHPEYSDMVSTAPAPQSTAQAQAPDVPWYEKAWQALTAPVGSHLDAYNKETQKLHDIQNSTEIHQPSTIDKVLKYAAPLVGLPIMDTDLARRTVAGMEADTADMLNPLAIATAGLGRVAQAPGIVGKAAQVALRTGAVAAGAKGTVDAAVNAPDALRGDPAAAQQALAGLAQAAGGAAATVNGRQFANAPVQDALARLLKDAPESVRAKLLPGTAKQLLVTATKPTVGLPDYEQSLENALPELAKRNPTTLKELVAAADDIRNMTNAQYENLKAQYRAPQGTMSVPPANPNLPNGGIGPAAPKVLAGQAAGPFNPAQVDLTPAAEAQMRSIPATDLFEEPNQQVAIQRGGRQILQGDPGIVAKTAQVADRYRTQVPVDTADALRVDTNAKLRSFFNKAAGDKAAALSDPETARTAAVNDAVRDALYDVIKSGTGVDPAPIQKLYGDAVDIGDTAARRETVFSRRQPNGITDAVNSGHPMALLLSKVIKSLNDNNLQVDWGMKRYANESQPQYSPNSRYVSHEAVLAAIASAVKQLSEQKQ